MAGVVYHAILSRIPSNTIPFTSQRIIVVVISRADLGTQDDPRCRSGEGFAVRHNFPAPPFRWIVQIPHRVFGGGVRLLPTQANLGSNPSQFHMHPNGCFLLFLCEAVGSPPTAEPQAVERVGDPSYLRLSVYWLVRLILNFPIVPFIIRVLVRPLIHLSADPFVSCLSAPAACAGTPQAILFYLRMRVDPPGDLLHPGSRLGCLCRLAAATFAGGSAWGCPCRSAWMSVHVRRSRGQFPHTIIC